VVAAKNAADVHGSSFSFVISPRIRVGKSTQTAFPPPCPLTSLPSGMGYAPETSLTSFNDMYI
jgi:hypothetical protein